MRRFSDEILKQIRNGSLESLSMVDSSGCPPFSCVSCAGQEQQSVTEDDSLFLGWHHDLSKRLPATRLLALFSKKVTPRVLLPPV